MSYVETKEYKELVHNTDNPFEGKDTSKRIAEKIECFLLQNDKSGQKVFYDYERQ